VSLTLKCKKDVQTYGTYHTNKYVKEINTDPITKLWDSSEVFTETSNILKIAKIENRIDNLA
jgi:hypothetical protein